MQLPPDLVILDLGLPDMDGQEVIRRLREWLLRRSSSFRRATRTSKRLRLWTTVRMIISRNLSVPGSSSRAFASHFATPSRAGDEAGKTSFECGDLKVDLSARRVFVSDAEVHLTPIEYKLLTTLIRNAGKVLTHRQLLKEVWGPDQVQETHYLRVFMANLRRKLETDPARPRYLLTEQGVGYRLASE